MNVVNYVKSHPWMTGIVVVVGAVVLFVILGAQSAGSTSSQSVVSGGPSDAEIAANAQIQAAQIQAQATAAQYSNQLAVAQIGAATQSEQSQLEAAVAQHALDVQEHLGLAETEANKVVNISNIQAQQSVANTQTNAQLSAVKSTNKSNTISNIVKGVGTIASIFAFSDARLKTNIRRIGEYAEGCGIYEYNYIWGSEKQRGVIAQEIINIRPDAVRKHISGYYQVDYSRL